MDSSTKLNLGSGQQYLEGYVNCDVVGSIKADKYFDLNQTPYPFASDSADEILMDNVLEHLDDIPKVMTELHRLLRPGGILKIHVPYGKSDWALQDPTHKHYFTEQSMHYFAAGHRYSHYTTCKFKVRRADLICDNTSALHKIRNLLPFKKYLRYLFYNVYDRLYFELEK